MKTATRSACVQGERSFAGSAKLRAYWLLSKPRVTILVWLTTLAGFVLGAWGQPLEGALVVAVLVGSWLVVASANTFNQALEWRYDAQMSRTASRPIPSGQVSVPEAVVLALLWGVSGVVLLALFVNGLVALLGLVSIVLYAFVYTPLKRYTPLCTAIGGIPGAIPPVAGWVSAQGNFAPEALLLFALQYIWQFPHLWAIAWLNAEDYAKVGFRLLPYTNDDGTRTGRLVFLYTVALVGFSLMFLPYVQKPALYLVWAGMIGVWHLVYSLQFYATPERRYARGVLMASVLYLPLLLLGLILSR